MNKVLYISNIEVPYRTEFFNQLSHSIDLTVIYERKHSSNRDEKWTKSVDSLYKKIYLNGIKLGNEFCFSLKIFKYLFNNNYNEIIFGCYNSPLQLFSIIMMDLFKKKYSINVDGDYDIEGNSLKKRIKRHLLKKAQKFYVAGRRNSTVYKKFFKGEVVSYNFSSLTKNDIEANSKNKNSSKNNVILVIGQYQKYKGLDIAVQVAKNDSNNIYRFVGMGNRSDKLKKYINKLDIKNIEIVPFLKKQELYKEYMSAKMLLLTSRKECWGLVINEAASFGCPILASKGCGAALEILNDKYSRFIIENNNPIDILKKIRSFENDKNLEAYKNYLIEISKDYTIENMVENYLKG